MIAINIFLFQVKRKLKCSHREKKTIKRYRVYLNDCIDEEPNLKTLKDFYARFGAPDQVANDFNSLLTPDEILKSRHEALIIRIVCICLAVACIISICLFAIMAKNRNSGVIEIMPKVVESTQPVY